MKPNRACRNLYAFIRLRLGGAVSDREIARRWSMEWKSFSALKHGRRQVPRVAELEQLAKLLSLDAAIVFEVARGVSAQKVQALLVENDGDKLAQLLMEGVHAVRHQAESQERRYAAILDRVSDAVFTIDVQGRFQDVNQRLCALTGYTSAELLERSLFDLLVPAQRPDLVARAAAVYQTGELRGALFTACAKSGEALELELGLTRIDGEGGQAIGIQGVAHDVTERRRLEQELQQQVAALRTTFDAVPAASLLFARDGTVLLANPLVENVCALTAAELTGRNASEVFGAPGPAECPVTRAFESGRVEQQISKVRNRRGEEVFVHRTAGPVLAANGQVDKVVEILVDVTDQVRDRATGSSFEWRQEALPADARPGALPADSEQRRFLRVPLEVPVRYHAGRRRGRAVARNLGRGGIYLQTQSSLPVGTEVTLDWVLPGRRARVKATGVVIWAEPGPRGPKRGVGIRFSDVSGPFIKAIAGCVSMLKQQAATPG